MPYPKRYEIPNLVLFNRMNDNPKEHISCFIDALCPHADDYNLCLREFSKSLTDRAYTWYTTLAPSFIRKWVNLVDKFYKKYFQHKEKKHGEDMVTFVKHFQDLALDCYDENDEEAFVEIYISNSVADYMVYLENPMQLSITFPKGKGLLHHKAMTFNAMPSFSLMKIWKWFSLIIENHCTGYYTSEVPKETKDIPVPAAKDGSL
ncbi:hypothetical protein D8674_010553 [Pyrus ussuriensis x Pyrus communis]|uniref:Retrotransposon gag domain-containing protein n=1 Tax=Pyrus ussuriensis x Pyrus communis TaxID=2448454 RepID=A0A5N5FGB6_9ROSA|nr:hypothetical protein D8674_010553 [Pyrus ussuriensis x Pyrus communis]